jgi:class 3 adenylate cyclase
VAVILIGSTALIVILTSHHLESTARSNFLHARLLAEEREKSERLLLNILPEAVVERLKNDPTAVAETHPNVSVLFADLVDFTPMSATLGAKEVVDLLNEVFSLFDQLTSERGLEKIKTIGDCYMAVGGLPLPRADHLTAIADLALAMQHAVAEVDKRRALGLTLRIGIHTGPVVAGVIGKNRYIYDLWGDTVNIASRMESHGVPGEIQVTPQVYDGLRGQFDFEARENVQVKGRGEMRTYLLAGDSRNLARREAAACN